MSNCHLTLARQVHKYALPEFGSFTLTLPCSSQVVHVGEQRGKPYMWILEPSHECRDEEWDFLVEMTGLKVDPKYQYVGSFGLEGNTYMGHVFASEWKSIPRKQ